MPRPQPAAKSKPSVDLKSFAGSFPSGIAVIATRGSDGTCHGITMNAVTSLSLDPPLYLICLGEQSITLALILESRRFSINLLAAHQAEISRTFASKCLDKFAGTPYRLGRLDCPVIEGAVAACECQVADVLPGGDHKIIVGRVHATHVFGGSPLLYHKGRYLDLEWTAGELHTEMQRVQQDQTKTPRAEQVAAMNSSINGRDSGKRRRSIRSRQQRKSG